MDSEGVLMEEGKRKVLVVGSIDHMDAARDGFSANNVFVDFVTWKSEGTSIDPLGIIAERANEYSIIVCSIDDESDKIKLEEFFDVMTKCTKMSVPILFFSSCYKGLRTRVRALAMPPITPNRDIESMWFSMIFEGSILNKNTWSRIWSRVTSLSEVINLDASDKFRRELEILRGRNYEIGSFSSSDRTIRKRFKVVSEKNILGSDDDEFSQNTRLRDSRKNNKRKKSNRKTQSKRSTKNGKKVRDTQEYYFEETSSASNEDKSKRDRQTVRKPKQITSSGRRY